MDKKKTNGGKHAWTDASVEFFSNEEQGICLVSAPQLQFLPRVGETVVLPRGDESKAMYEVIDVNYNFYREMAGKLGPQEARLISINVTVKRK